MKVTFGTVREVQNKLQIIEYKNGNGDFHAHSQIELCIVNSGKINAFVGKKCKLLKQNEVTLALGYETHAYIPLTDAEFTVIVIPSDMSEHFLSLIKHKTPESPFICEKTALENIGSAFRALKKSKNSLEKIGNAYLLLSVVAENLVFEVLAETEDGGLLSELLSYIHNNYKKDITLTTISKTFCYNPSYISRYFKSHLGIGIIQYINIVRLKNALKLMQNKENSATFCALDSGFNSVRTFYRVFNNEFHCAPKEYLKNF